MLFLDTTVQVERIFGPAREALRALVRSIPARTSTYVWEEFRSTFLQDAVLLHTLLSEEDWDVAAALRRAAKYPVTGRKHARIRQILADLLQKPWPSTPHDVRDRLEQLIEGGLEYRFWRGLDKPSTLDETGCQRGGAPPHRENNIYRFKPRCRTTDEPICQVDGFWKERDGDLQAIAAALAQLPAHLSEVAALAADILQKTASPRGRNCFGVMADCVIASEAPLDDEIWTTNRRDFEPICATIGRNLFAAPPDDQLLGPSHAC